MALACDLIVASRDARLALPEVTRGLIPDAGGVLRLPKRIPRALAMEMLLTGRPVEAEEAERWGLVNQVVAPGELMEAARELARRIIAAAPLAVEAVKAIALATEELSVAEGYAALRSGAVPEYERSNSSEDARRARARSPKGASRSGGGGEPGRRAERRQRGRRPRPLTGARRQPGQGCARHRRRHRDRAARPPRPSPLRAPRWRSAAARREPLEEARAGIEGAGAECLAVPADIREPDEVSAPCSTRCSSASAGPTCWSTTPAASSRRPPRRSRQRAGARCTGSRSTRHGI